MSQDLAVLDAKVIHLVLSVSVQTRQKQHCCQVRVP